MAQFRVAWHLVGESEAEYLTLLAVAVVPVGGAGGVASPSSPAVIVVFSP